MEVQGKLKVINETQTYGSNGFRKRECVITTDEQYPQDIQIEFVQDKCDLLDKCKLGEEVKIGINLRGREWVNPQGETKYFNSIQGWRIEGREQSTVAVPVSPTQAFNEVPAQASEDDDLPF